MPAKGRDSKTDAPRESIKSAATKKRSRTTRSDGTSSKRKRQRRDSEDSVSPQPRTAVTAGGVSGRANHASEPRSSHVRFGSEEVAEVSATQPQPTYVAEEEEVDSDDDAPEDISATAASNATKKSEAAVAEAIKQHQTRQKKKRQENTVRLEAQVRTSERRAAKKDSDKDRIRRVQQVNDQQPQIPLQGSAFLIANDESDEDDVPELLPEEILREEYVRPPTPPPVDLATLRNAPQRSRKLELEAPKLRDRRVGPVNVSVLSKVNKHLPPKGSKGGRGVREGWLEGRPGRGAKGGTVVVERKPFNSKFITS